MASRKTSETRTEPNLAEAAEKATLVIRGLQSRLQPRPANRTEEGPEELELELEQYFARTAPTEGRLAEIRNRVVDGVVERILRQWEDGAVLEPEIIERLIQRILDRLE